VLSELALPLGHDPDVRLDSSRYAFVGACPT
jgi:hypothetical protein